jgi:hypothetical protein
MYLANLLLFPLQDNQVAKEVNRRFDLVNITQRVEES